jgi:hypothetical protein
MPVLKPKGGEDQNTFISRCMSALADEDKPQDQKLAMCYTSWRRSKGEESIQKAINIVQKTIDKIEMDELMKMYYPELEEVEGKVNKDISNLANSHLQFIKEIYVKCRQDGNNITKSYDTATVFFQREGRNIDIDVKDLYKAIYHVIKSIRDRVIEKQEKGQTKMIFGKPFTWSGSEWVPAEGPKEEEKPKERPHPEDKPPSDVELGSPKEAYELIQHLHSQGSKDFVGDLEKMGYSPEETEKIITMFNEHKRKLKEQKK